jgi:N-acetylmuramoyl-L-alanine amidase
VRTRWGVGVVLAVGVFFSAGHALASPQQAGDQVALRALGFYKGPIDGQVGPLTRAAVEVAQTHAHLPVTGVITTRTRNSLGPLGRPLFGTRTIVAGDFGLDVSVLQFLLARTGYYHGALDGFMGRKVDTALRAFQNRAGLGVDGIAGPDTLAKLVATSRHHHAGLSVQPPHATYVVRPGDSLTAIATHYGVSMATLARLNSLDPTKALLVGTRLTVPAAAVATRPPAPQQTYVVQPGDSLTMIAAHYEVSMPALARLNHLDPAKALLIGAHITVPVAAAHASLAAAPADVRSTLDDWAARLGVSSHLVRALSWMESGYQPSVVSSVGARGVLQVMPTTRDYVEQVLVGHPVPHTLDGDVEVGILYLRHLLGQFNGDTRLALAAWYQGEAAVRKFGLYQMTKPFVADVLALQQRM